MLFPFLCLSYHIKSEDVALMFSFLIDKTLERMSLVYPSSNWLYLAMSKASNSAVRIAFQPSSFSKAIFNGPFFQIIMKNKIQNFSRKLSLGLNSRFSEFQVVMEIAKTGEGSNRRTEGLISLETGWGPALEICC